MQTAPSSLLRVAATLAVGTLLAATTACGGSDDPGVKLGTAATASPTESPSSTATPSASGAAAAPTKPSLPAASNDAAGRSAFARYVVAAIAYGLGTNDGSAITSVALTHGTLHCATCTAFTVYLKQQAAKQQVRRPWQLPVTHLQDQGQVQPGLSLVDVIVRRPALWDVDASGVKHRPQAADPHYVFEVGMQWDAHTWKLTGWVENKQ